MARVDSLLAQLIAYEADALVIEGGDNAFLVKGEAKKSLLQGRSREQGGALTNQHVKALLDEIADRQAGLWLARADVDDGSGVAFRHRFGSCEFVVEVASVAGRLFARFRAEVAAAVVEDRAVDEDAPDDDVDDVAPPPKPGLARFIQALVECGGSDLHLAAGRRAMARVDGALVPLVVAGEADVVDGYRLQSMLDDVVPEALAPRLRARRPVEFAVVIGGARVRCSVSFDVAGVFGVFRRFFSYVPGLDALGMPDVVKDLAGLDRGLIVVNGAAGHGRSTTVAALVEHINLNRAVHIVTLEDPVEVVHVDKRALIHQRTIEGSGEEGLAAALRDVAREDADVVVCGELRDAEAVRAALDLADRGSLVIVQTSSPTSSSCLQRLLERVPSAERDAARSLLADNLRAVIHQTLCKKIGGGRVAAVEVIVAGLDVKDALRCGAVDRVAASSSSPSVRLNDALRELVACGVISPEEAVAHADSSAVVERGSELRAVA